MQHLLDVLVYFAMIYILLESSRLDSLIEVLNRQTVCMLMMTSNNNLWQGTTNIMLVKILVLMNKSSRLE